MAPNPEPRSAAPTRNCTRLPRHPAQRIIEAPAMPLPLRFDPFLTRRDLLRVGSVAVASAAVPALGKAQDAATAKAVVLLWMAGGMTHHESFDPKPDAPAEIRGTLKP